MTRKDYVLLAESVKKVNLMYSLGTPESTTVAMVTLALSEALASDNPRFDQKQFLNAALGR